MTCGINVLSLFDGMSCGHIALDKVGIEVNNYYASEIDKYAIQITQKNYPSTIQLGDVTKWRDWDIDWSAIGLVTGGFPCQAWSVAGKQLGDKDERGMLFWTMLDIMKNVLYHNPQAKFLIENVKMKKEFEEYITYHAINALGKLNKHLINSALVSAQNRQRYYWTNIENIEQPEDKGILLKDIIEDDSQEPMLSNIYGGFKETKPRVHYDKSVTLRANSGGGAIPSITLKKKLITVDENGNIIRNVPSIGQAKRIYSIDGISPSLNIGWTPNVYENPLYRQLKPVECERLQTIPDGYTEGVSNTQRYKMLGNGWTVDVIAHILKEIK